ncbi:hypothetical protein SEVIR_9G230255v4 [Setaria viridis]
MPPSVYVNPIAFSRWHTQKAHGMTRTYELVGCTDGRGRGRVRRAYPAAVLIGSSQNKLLRYPGHPQLRSLSARPARAQRRCPAAHQLPSRVTSRRRLPPLPVTGHATAHGLSAIDPGGRHGSPAGRWRTRVCLPARTHARGPGARRRTHTKPCRAGWLRSRPPLSTGAT